MEIRKARIEERDQINAMIMRSKAHWGYDEAFIEACREELSLSAERLLSNNLRVLAIGDVVVGTVEIVMDGQEAHLYKLFVEPDVIGSGAGRILYEWALTRAKLFNATAMLIEADPDASQFYEYMGAKIIGKIPSESIPDRFLPLMRHEL